MIARRLEGWHLPGAPISAKLWNGLVRRPARRLGLRRRLTSMPRMPGLTAVVPVRNRSGDRVRNLLRSLNEQSAREALHIVVVDYGSDVETAHELVALAAEARAEVLRVDAPGEWSRAAALNAGLRRALTAHVMCTDADLVFERRFVEIALRRLHDDPRRIVVSAMLELPQGHPRTISPEDFTGLRLSARARWDAPYHPSIFATTTAALIAVGGYDETYRLWGMEDVDLFARLRGFGLSPCDVSRETGYLHQWHPRFDGVDGPALERQIRANEDHFRSKRDAGAIVVGRRRRAILTAAGPHMWPLLERYSLPTFWRFADRWGYDVLPARLPNDRDGEHGAGTNVARWAKLPLLRAALDDYDVVIWLDADVMICRFDDDLGGHLGEGKFQAFALEHVPQDRRLNPNSGVWVLRRGPRARRFLRAVARAGQQPGPWADQAAIMRVLGWNPGGAWYHDAGPGRGSSFLQGTGWLPPSWNQLHTVHGEVPEGVHAVPRVARPHALHFAGISNAERERLMRETLAAIS